MDSEKATRSASSPSPVDGRRSRADQWRIGLGMLVLLFTILSYDDGYMRWWYLSLSMGTGVLLLQFTRFSLVRTYALWFGIFLVVQSLISVYFFDDDYRTLVPNLAYERDAGEGTTPGIEGVHTITSDALGFRTFPAVDYSDAAPLRIFAVGGSTTEQILLDDRQTSTYLLQEALRQQVDGPVEVVNTGVSGLRANNHVATLHKIAALHPDMMLILLGVNDWNRQILLQFPDDLPPSVAQSWQGGWQHGIRFRNTLLGRLVVKLQRSLTSKQLERVVARGGVNVAHKDSLSRPDKREFRPQAVSDEYARHLVELFALCTELDVPCLFATQPHAYDETASAEMRREFWMTPPYADYTLDLGSMQHIAQLYNDYLRSQATQHGFRVCDLAAGMKPTLDSFYDDVHFNTQGAATVAELLYPCILREIDAH